MNCGSTCLAITSPRLKRVLSHWCEARGNRLMPAWRDIRPAEIRTELPIVWSYRYDAGQDEFIGGLAGDAIQRLFGRPLKNANLRHLYDMDYERFFARAKQVLFKPALFLGKGLLFKERERQCYGERIILPFSCENGRAGGIFGATDFKFAFLYESGAEARALPPEKSLILN